MAHASDPSANGAKAANGAAPAAKPEQTPLQRHAAFFDPEETGVVTMGQTWRGLRSLGIGIHYRVLLTPIINGALGYLTRGNARFVIDVSNIAAGKHPYDTGVFADDGEIDEQAYAALLLAAPGDKLTKKEMRAQIVARGNHRPQLGKLTGALGRWFSFREVSLLLCLAADTTKREDGRDVPAVSKRNLRRFYDGTLLPAIARQRRIRAHRAASA